MSWSRCRLWQVALPLEPHKPAYPMTPKCPWPTEWLMEYLAIPNRRLDQLATMTIWKQLWLAFVAGESLKALPGAITYPCDPNFLTWMGISAEPWEDVCAAAFHHKWKRDMCGQSHADPQVKWTAKQVAHCLVPCFTAPLTSSNVFIGRFLWPLGGVWDLLICWHL